MTDRDAPDGSRGVARARAALLFVGCVAIGLAILVPLANMTGSESGPIVDVSSATLPPQQVPLAPDRPTTLARGAGTTTTRPRPDVPARPASTLAMTSPTPTPTSTPVPTSTVTSTTLPRSPLAELLDARGSAAIEPFVPRIEPVGLEIESIDVTRYPIRRVGLLSTGDLEIPGESEIGWYRFGSSAGRPGATVLAAHVSWNGVLGPFAYLGRVEPGDRVAVELADGARHEYRVTERALYGKRELPRDRIWRIDGPETLVLITCGGDFNPQVRRYRQNIVVFAEPVH